MTGNNGFRVPDPFERSYGGAAPWEQQDPTECSECEGTGICPECDGENEECKECGGSVGCLSCDGKGHV